MDWYPCGEYRQIFEAQVRADGEAVQTDVMRQQREQLRGDSRRCERECQMLASIAADVFRTLLCTDARLARCLGQVLIARYESCSEREHDSRVHELLASFKEMMRIEPVG